MDQEKKMEMVLETVQQLLKQSKFDESINILEPLIKEALKFYHEDQICYKMAQYYYTLGTAILAKIETDQEIFGIDQLRQTQSLPPQDQVQEIQHDSNQNYNNKINNDDKINIDYDDNDDNEKDDYVDDNNDDENVEDIQVAWENLELAKEILGRKLKDLKEDDDKRKIMNELGRVHMRIGDLEMWREQFKESIEEYSECLKIRRQIENELESRNIAEIYFTLANLVQYQNEENAEQKSLDYLYKTKLIIENNLAKAIDPQAEFNHMINKQIDRSFVVQNQQDSQLVQELKTLLTDIYDKIDDLILVIDQKKIINNINTNTTDSFNNSTNNNNNKNIINLGVMGNAHKKTKTEDNSSQRYDEKGQTMKQML